MRGEFTLPDNVRVLVRKYHNANVNAALNVVQAETGFPYLASVFYRGVTSYQITLHFSKGSSEDCTIPGQDIAVETEEHPFIKNGALPGVPLDIKMSEGEFIDLLNPLTVNVEGTIYFYFTNVPLGPQKRCVVHTWTDTDAEPAAFVPANSPDDIKLLRGYFAPGIDLEAFDLAWSLRKVSTFLGRDVTALADCTRAPEFVPHQLSGVENKTLQATDIHHGTGGVALLFLLYDIIPMRRS